MSVRLKLALALAALLAYGAAALAALIALVRSDLEAADRSVLDRILREEAALAAGAAVLFGIGLGVLVASAFRLYVIAPRRLAEETRLIASANPRHRVTARRPAELRRLAAAINDLAERLQSAEEDVAAQIDAAHADLAQERNRLAALMAELRLAVLVCNRDGRILLYNDAATALLDPDEDATGLVGLGRSVFGILDRSLLAHALERLSPGAADSAAAGVRLTATAAGGQLLRVGVAPVRGAGEELTGFVLSLEDVTRAAELSGDRDALLQSLTEGTRASVATIRAAVESMLDYPELVGAERERFEEVIRHEAVGLGELVEAAVREHAGDLRAQWSLEEMLGRDLLAALRRSLEGGLSVTATEPPDDLWLEVDSYAVVQAVGHLAGRLRADAGVEHLRLELRPVGRHARLGLGWDGQPLREETLRAWASEPLQRDGGGIAPTLRDVVEDHGGELWCEPDSEAGGAWVRLLLPLAAVAPGARPTPATPRGETVERRPEFYDFDLFQPAEAAAGWDDRRLDALAYTVFDTETTGLSPSGGDEIVSIGAVRIVNGRLLRRETFDRLVDPRRSVSPASVAVHGITAELLRGQPTIDAVLPDFARFAEDTVLVGHNIGFDLRFIELKEAQTGVRLRQPVLDTLLLSAVVHPDHEDHSLEAMAARLGVSVIGRHTALGDAILTGEVFLGQLRLLLAQGTTTLGEARSAAQRTYAARKSESLYSRA